jgi:hypothetical protein
VHQKISAGYDRPVKRDIFFGHNMGMKSEAALGIDGSDN